MQGIKKVKINKKAFFGTIKKNYDSGSILDFEIFEHKVYLGIEWTNYPPKRRETEFSSIEIEAKTIYWKYIRDVNGKGTPS